MKKTFRYLTILVIITTTFLVGSPDSLLAQRLGHSRGGGGFEREAGARREAGFSRQEPERRERSINGGSSRPAPGRQSFDESRNNNFNSNNRNTNVGNRTNVGGNSNNRNVSGNNINVGNKTNINNNRTNININNSHNTNIVVRPPVRPYPRPPYVYGGFRYNCYHPYFYHPYHPFYWGPVYHPWGFFIATLTATAIIVSVNNQQYHYDQGVYYVESNGGYTVVQAPVGATITTLPQGSETVVVNQTTNNYYYGGTYYEKSDDGYTVVAPTAGTVVENLPEGGEEVKIGDVTYVKVGDVYYQPIQQDGKNMYEVADVQKAS